MQVSKIFFALGFMALGAGASLLYSNWDSVNNKVLAMMHKPHFVRPRNIEAMMVPVTITGEVVDSWCYASQTMGPGQGQGHLACATACILGGVTPGILEENTGELFIAVKYKGYQGCNELLKPYIGKIVTVHGYMGYRGNTRVLKISTVEPVAKEGTGASANPALDSTGKPSTSAPAPTNSPTSSTEVAKPIASAAAAGKDDCPECNEATGANAGASVGSKKAN
jgi:hypothetical protein